MICKSCGNELPEGAKFCTSCGAKAEAAEVEAAAVEKEPEAVTEEAEAAVEAVPEEAEGGSVEAEVASDEAVAEAEPEPEAEPIAEPEAEAIVEPEEEPIAGPEPEAPPAPAEDIVFCTKCGASYKRGTAFCNICGNSLIPKKTFCKHCGREIPEAMAFCALCGTKKGDAAPVSAQPAAPVQPVAPAVQAEKPKHPKKGAAVCSLVFGILSWLTCCLNLIFAIVGLACGSSALKKGKIGVAKAGKILSLISLIRELVVIVLVIALLVMTVGGAVAGVASLLGSVMSVVEVIEDFLPPGMIDDILDVIVSGEGIGSILTDNMTLGALEDVLGSDFGINDIQEMLGPDVNLDPIRELVGDDFTIGKLIEEYGRDYSASDIIAALESEEGQAILEEMFGKEMSSGDIFSIFLGMFGGDQGGASGVLPPSDNAATEAPDFPSSIRMVYIPNDSNYLFVDRCGNLVCMNYYYMTLCMYDTAGYNVTHLYGIDQNGYSSYMVNDPAGNSYSVDLEKGVSVFPNGGTSEFYGLDELNKINPDVSDGLLIMPVDPSYGVDVDGNGALDYPPENMPEAGYDYNINVGDSGAISGIDSDGDGVIDYWISGDYVDEDGDGLPDNAFNSGSNGPVYSIGGGN